MKKFILLMLISLPMLSQAQDSAKSEAIYHDVKASFKGVTEGLIDLAAKLEGPAKRTYEIYVRQQLFEGVAHACIAIVLAIVGVVLTVRTYSKANWNEGNKYTFPAVVGVILCGKEVNHFAILRQCCSQQGV